VAFSIVHWQKRKHDIARIRDQLFDKGYREIVIHSRWFDFDKSNSTYEIECRSPRGGRVTTTCKIHRSPSFDQDIFWKDAL
jgi:hypothetical protein